MAQDFAAPDRGEVALESGVIPPTASSLLSGEEEGEEKEKRKRKTEKEKKEEEKRKRRGRQRGIEIR